METARRLGISLKRFEGWSPRQTTTHHYKDGQLTGSTTVTESEWDARERVWMLALEMYDATVCPRCTTSTIESADPDHDQDNPYTSLGYVAEAPTECFACKALNASHKAFEKSSPDMAPYLIHNAVLRPKTPRVTRPRRVVKRDG